MAGTSSSADRPFDAPGGGGSEAKNKVCVPKIGLKFPAPLTNFIFAEGYFSDVEGGGRPGLARAPNPPPPWGSFSNSLRGTTRTAPVSTFTVLVPCRRPHVQQTTRFYICAVHRIFLCSTHLPPVLPCTPPQWRVPLVSLQPCSPPRSPSPALPQAEQMHEAPRDSRVTPVCGTAGPCQVILQITRWGSPGGGGALDFITVPGLSTATLAILLPDRKAPMVPLMRIFLCCCVLALVTSTLPDSKRGHTAG